MKLGREVCDAIQSVTPSRQYTVGSAGAIFYVAGGASDDYAKVGCSSASAMHCGPRGSDGPISAV